MSRKYEVTYILDPTIGDEAVNGLVEKFSGTITSNGGEIQEVKPWGKRRFAYEMKSRNDGFYVTMKYSASPEATAELRRLLGLADEVLRSLFIREN